MLEPFTPRPRGSRQATTFKKLAKHPPRKKIQITPSIFISMACDDSMYLQYSNALTGSWDVLKSVDVSRGIKISRMNIEASKTHPSALLRKMNFACLPILIHYWSRRLAAAGEPK